MFEKLGDNREYKTAEIEIKSSTSSAPINEILDTAIEFGDSLTGLEEFRLT